MFTTGSKLLIGSSVLAAVAAILYGVTQDGVMGTVGLVSAAIALGVLAGVNVYTADANVWADEVSSLETVSAAYRPTADNIWPMGFALGVAVLALGLVTTQAVFIAGIVLLLGAGAEWMLAAWADQASDDPAYNAEVRTRLAAPLEIPIGVVAVMGVMAYAFSRIMLWLSKTNTVIAFSIVGILILALAFFFASRPKVTTGVVTGAIGIGALVIVAGGVAAGVDGEREIEEHETTSGLAEEGVDICESPEEFEADEKATQSVAARAAVAATITLDEAGELSYELNGPSGEGAPGITLPRSNPNNIVFVNQSSEHRRLSVDLGTEVVEEDGEEVERRQLECTALVDTDGEQNITLIIGAPSISAPDGYFFFVPGVDSARIDLIVP
jgi:hypothetical protein